MWTRAASADIDTARRGSKILGPIAALVSGLGCAPTVNIIGTYLPASLVSAAIGLVVSYALVRILARSSALRSLAQSALLFASLTIIAAFAAWWSLFRGF